MKLIETEVKEFMYSPKGYGYIEVLQPLFRILPWVGAQYVVLTCSAWVEPRAEIGATDMERQSMEEKDGFRETH